MRDYKPMKPNTRLSWIEFQMANLIAHRATGGATPTHEDQVVIKTVTMGDNCKPLPQQLQDHLEAERGSMVSLTKCAEAYRALFEKGVLWSYWHGPESHWKEGFTSEGYNLWAAWADGTAEDDAPADTDKDKALAFLKTQEFFVGLSKDHQRTLVNVLTAPQEHSLFKSFCYATLFKA